MTTLLAGSASETGLVRSNNQDAVLLAEPLFAVADGMGGHAAGEVASRVAVDTLRSRPVATLEELIASVRDANRAIFDRAADTPSLRGMGTTLCAVALIDVSGQEVVGVANVGDSRVYLLHDGELSQITDDHSLVGDLQREGRLSEAEARTHPQRNILTRVLGNEAEVAVDTWSIIPYTGDRYLLCSDGLFNEVDESRIAAVLRRLRDPAEASRELVRLANEAGGRDNISALVVDVADDGGRSREASAALAAQPDATNGSGTTIAPVVPPPPAAPPPTTTTQAPAVGVPPPPLPPAGAPKRRATGRVVAFVFAVVAVLLLGAGAVALFARGTYYVGVDGERVAIYRGRPGGLLWVDPTLEETTDLPIDDVPVSRRPDVEAGRQVSSLDDARDYVENLREQSAVERGEAEAAEDNEGTDPAPISTTSTSPAPIAPSTAPVPPTAAPPAP